MPILFWEILKVNMFSFNFYFYRESTLISVGQKELVDYTKYHYSERRCYIARSAVSPNTSALSLFLPFVPYMVLTQSSVDGMQSKSDVKNILEYLI